MAKIKWDKWWLATFSHQQFHTHVTFIIVLLQVQDYYGFKTKGSKSIKTNTLPTVGVGANLYYINPSGKFIPSGDQYLMPVTLGANISWNIGNLWTNKNKISEARVQQKSVVLQKDIETDQIKTEINRNYQSYQLALSRIKILETSIAQATENDKLLASKYKNNVASAIDRIDAETLLYQAKINLELAKADAGLAYYTLLKSTGKISQ